MRGCTADVGEWAPIREMWPNSHEGGSPITYGPHIGFAQNRDDARRWAAARKMEKACRLMIEANESADPGNNGIDQEKAAAAAAAARDAIEDIEVPREEYIGHMVAKCLKGSAQ
mgnify:FL=1